ncbi:hypothetical protein [Streptomyces sp. NPDC007369]|uniref:hypothetical protein n=1 Tax=Streptomyces sp. NPDC007369 TaxID=3154589 RepID=UPI0033D03357
MTGLAGMGVRVRFMPPHDHRIEVFDATSGRRDPFAGGTVAEVVLGLVQPHHRPWTDPAQLRQRGLRTGRVEGVPQPPPLLSERLDGLPARPGLPRRGGTHEHHDPAAARSHIPYRIGQHPVMRARHIAGQQWPHGRFIRTGDGLTGASGVDFQLVRLPHPDRPARPYPIGSGHPRTLFLGPLQLQEFALWQLQRGGQRRDRLCRRHRCCGGERLRHGRTPQPCLTGKLRLVPPGPCQPLVEPGTQFGEGLLVGILVVVHVLPPGQ